MTTYYLQGQMIWLNYYVDGKRIRKSTKLKNTRKNIQLVKTKIIPSLDIKIATGTIYKKKPKSFEYYGDKFLKEKEDNRSYSTKYAYYMRVINYFRGQDIDSISRLDIKEYLTTLNMKSKSKAEYRNCVKEIFELAVDDGVITFNPALDIRLKPDKKEPIQFYTKEEVNKLLSVAKGIMKAYLLIAFNTGLRIQEILGLQISDFCDDGYIFMKRTRSKGQIGDGKTRNAQRKVPYPKFILEEVKKIQSKKHIFLFGDISDAMHLRHPWEKVCKDADLPRYRLYSTRHTFATLMLRDKIVSINELAGLLGHSSPKVTLEHYASVIESKSINLGENFSLYGHNTVIIENEKVD